MNLKNGKSQPIKNLKAVAEITEAEKSKVRVGALTANIFNAIAETTKTTEGDINIFEITEALLTIARSYNKRFLDEQNGVNNDKKG